jgi:hypothetical protein
LPSPDPLSYPYTYKKSEKNQREEIFEVIIEAQGEGA